MRWVYMNKMQSFLLTKINYSLERALEIARASKAPKAKQWIQIIWYWSDFQLTNQLYSQFFSLHYFQTLTTTRYDTLDFFSNVYIDGIHETAPCWFKKPEILTPTISITFTPNILAITQLKSNWRE